MNELIHAAGAVLWRAAGPDATQVAVVHRQRYDDWSLPKGKLDGDETPASAAVREIAEETGSACVLGPYLLRIEYPVDGVHKVVDYFAARATEGGFAPNDEVDELRWLDAGQARELLSYDRDVAVLDAFTALGGAVSTLLLVRHAKAGSRDGWTGDDDLRPLTPNGERQVELLTEQLRLFAPDRVLSAPRLRCVQTVRGVAGELDADITHEPLMSEDGYREAPKEARGRLREIAAGGGTPVVCSQGGVIPDLLAAIAEEDGLRLTGDLPSKKASAWLLAFRPEDGREPRLVAAHYLPPPSIDD